jgi:hypothetical protein
MFCLFAQGQGSARLRLEFLKVTLKQNTDGHWQIFSFLCPLGKVAPSIDDPDSVKFLPYIGSNFNIITRALKRQNNQLSASNLQLHLVGSG